MPAGSMSLAEFREWTCADNFPETGLIAYIGDEIFIDRNPERLKSHGSVAVAVCSTVGSLVRQQKSGKLFIGRSRFANVVAAISTEPDALFAKWDSFKKDRIRRMPTRDELDYIELEGSPDWILEIVSPRSVVKDKVKLRARYHSADIGEYWLIDARREEIDFQILIHSENEYELAPCKGDWQTSKLFGKKFRLRRIKDELGDVDYQLDVK